MAQLFWGKVFYKDFFAGYLREEPGNSFIFTYDPSYIEMGNPAISHGLPVQKDPHICQNALHPFFDNLISEGWLYNAQARLLGKRNVKPFELLLAFGFDCAGAVSVLDPEPYNLTKALMHEGDPKERSLFSTRTSISGVQPKLGIIEENGLFRPVKIGELSTHIAKFATPNHLEFIENEYLTTCAFQALLPDQEVVQLKIDKVKGIDEQALIIKRFDRQAGERIHFEEFSQLLRINPNAKYDGAYQDMADFIIREKGCMPVQNYALYHRILAGLLLGNTDMHFKNFAMFHTPEGFRFTPSYDQLAVSYYDYKTIALKIAGASNLPIGNLKPRSVIRLGEEFKLSRAAINMAVENMRRNLHAAKEAITEAQVGSEKLKNGLIEIMEKRWNGSFDLIGKILLSKQ